MSMKYPKEIADIELTDCHDCGWWSCVVNMTDGRTLDCCEVFSDSRDGYQGMDISTLRDMSGKEPVPVP